MMPLTSPGLLQRPAMPCYCAGWSRVRLMAGWKLKKIDRIRRAYAQRHNTGQGSAQRAQDKHSATKTATCVYFNKGMCSQKQTHETKGVLYKHICALCWAKDSKAYPHPQTECCRSTKNV